MLLSNAADDDYVKFVASLENAEPEVIATPEVFLEEIEARERLAKGQSDTLTVTLSCVFTEPNKVRLLEVMLNAMPLLSLNGIIFVTWCTRAYQNLLESDKSVTLL